MMVGVSIDDRKLQQRFDKLIAAYPKAVSDLLNVSAFEVRAEWAKQILSVFDRPTPLTQRAPLYKKSTPQHLVAEVFIRDEVSGGVAPARYLRPQVFGGVRARKASERAMRSRLTFPSFWVPGKEAPLDKYGNVPGSLVGKILSQLQASRVKDQRETALKRGRRLKRERSKGSQGNYFVLQRRRGKLFPGVVYERISVLGAGENGGRASEVRAVLFGVPRPPRYTVRFDVFELAQRLYRARVRANAKKILSRVGATT
jgi:hypothetical protein